MLSSSSFRCRVLVLLEQTHRSCRSLYKTHVRTVQSKFQHGGEEERVRPTLPPVHSEADDCICNVTGRSPGPAALPSRPCWSLSPASINQNEPFYPHTDSCQVLCCRKKESDSYSKSSLACLSLLAISFSWLQAENHTFQPRASTGVFTQMAHEYQRTIL